MHVSDGLRNVVASFEESDRAGVVSSTNGIDRRSQWCQHPLCAVASDVRLALTSADRMYRNRR